MGGGVLSRSHDSKWPILHGFEENSFVNHNLSGLNAMREGV